MADLETLRVKLAPVVEFARTLDPAETDDAKAKLDERFPLSGDAMVALRALVREGIDAGWLADREAGGVRFSRVRKAEGLDDVSVDVVHMNQAGPGHTHPNGEMDLCFTVSGDARFDRQPEGWTVYGPGSWHVPTVTGGVMDILYFLPGGAIRFESEPK
ncbi:MAG: DUF4863 domain-containing protein [Deltaproteobacteria bacterium]|nr:MAG: DUF4863 domain-containing protein [Deltaproteobacteria bacterium]